jgi:hypothetical protein
VPELFKIVFSLLALIGAWLALRSRDPDAAPYALTILSYPVVFYLTHGSARYRYPIDPILTLLAVSALAYPLRLLMRLFGSRRAPRPSGAATVESVTP